MSSSYHEKDAETVFGGLYALYTATRTPVTAQALRANGFRWPEGYVESCLDLLVENGQSEKRDGGYVPLVDGEVPPPLDT